MSLAKRWMLSIVTTVMCAVTMGAQGHGQNFFFAEETWRLPADTTLPGTSTTDVDLIDVDDDGDLGSQRPPIRQVRCSQATSTGMGIST